MAMSRLKLPTSMQKGGDSTSFHDGEVSRIPLGAGDECKVQMAKLQVAKEALRTVTAFLELGKSYLDLQATRAEWAGRVEVAAQDLARAEVELQKAVESNKVQLTRLAQVQEAQTRLLSLFDALFEQFSAMPLGSADQTAARELLLRLSEQLVQLRK